MARASGKGSRLTAWPEPEQASKRRTAPRPIDTTEAPTSGPFPPLPDISSGLDRGVNVGF